MKKDKHIQNLVKKLIDASFKDGKLIELQVTKAIKLLKSLPKYQAIQALTDFIKALKREERKYTMFVEAAIPLPLLQLKKIKKIIEKKQKITKVITSVNPDILGGFRLRIGDEIWDETILNKINQVKEAITHGRPD